MSDDYVTVTATLKARTRKAVLLATSDNLDGSWVPRSCIHGGDESKINDYAIGDEIELRMFEWIAEKESLA